MESAQGGEPIQLTQNNDTYIRSLQWSPDSKSILYTDRKNRIVLVDVAAKTKRVVMQNPEGEFWDVDYAPDSRWITYTKPASNEMSVVYLYDLVENKEYPVTEKWYNSSEPIFSTDGKYLIFCSNRDFNPVYGSLEWNHVYLRTGGIYFVTLDKTLPSPFLPKDAAVDAENESEAAVTDGKAEGKKQTDGNTKDAKKNSTLKIDTEDMYARIVKLPLEADSYRNFYCDGERIWYYAKGRPICLTWKSRKTKWLPKVPPWMLLRF